MRGMKREITGHVPPAEDGGALFTARLAYRKGDHIPVLWYARMNWKAPGERQKKLDEAENESRRRV
jgi:hypothetical protein